MPGVISKHRARLIETRPSKQHPLNIVARPQLDFVKVAGVGNDWVGGCLIVNEHRFADQVECDLSVANPEPEPPSRAADLSRLHCFPPNQVPKLSVTPVLAPLWARWRS
jgi:hypothetical protein